MNKRKTWQRIFDEHPYISTALNNDGWIVLTADELRVYGEPRILAKIDSFETLPKVFKKHNAALLSLTNDSYIILKLGQEGKPLFPKLPPVTTPPRYYSPQDLQDRFVTLDWQRHFTSESQALDAAFLAGILQDFTQDNELYLTIRGRRRLATPIALQFSIPSGSSLSFPQSIQGVQIEVDAGYESPRHVYLVEAKKRLQTTFNLRQVYFPFAHWQAYLQNKRSAKTIRPLYLLYTAHQYFLYEFSIRPSGNLNDISVKHSQWYVLGEPPLTLGDLSQIVQATASTFVPHIPFPQADNLSRVFNILERIAHQPQMSAEEIAQEEAIVVRQGNYYLSALRWLGWLEGKGTHKKLTKEGRRVLKASAIERPQRLIRVLASRPVFRQAIQQWSQTQNIPSQKQIEQWIFQETKRKHISPLADSTIPRRAQTVRAWLQNLTVWVRTTSV